MRGYHEVCIPYMSQIPEIVIQLLCTVPQDAANTRKELLVATRHIWQTPFRVAFVPHVHMLLNEDILITKGITARDALRPLAFTMLAELLHHIRDKLDLSQVTHAIEFFSKFLLDASFTPDKQTISVKLLIPLLDLASRISPRSQTRDIVVHVLSIFAARLVSLSQYLKDFRVQNQLILTPSTPSTSVPDSPFEINLYASRPLKSGSSLLPTPPTHSIPHASPQDLQQEKSDLRVLLRFLIAHLRPLVSALRACSVQTPAAHGSATNPPPPITSTHVFSTTSSTYYMRISNAEEAEIFKVILRSALECFEYYWIDIPVTTTTSSHTSTSTSSQDVIFSKMGPLAKEEKEILDYLCSIFIILDPALFQEIFSSNLDFLFHSMLRDTSLLAVPQFLLGHEHISQRFGGLLLGYLMKKLPELGATDELRSAVILRLFKLIFMSVTHYPEHNEAVLQVHLAKLISQCLKLSLDSPHPIHYFSLLRALFRSIGGGRFELLYTEVLPLLPILLDNLNHLLYTSHTSSIRDLLVELCLTVPVRLSVLLPYLSHLMRPLVLALQSCPELVTQGLRTLELCIDNLTQEFLDPIMAPVVEELMASLWRHLKPPPYNQQHAHATMRILGKLGGRNRRYLKWSLPLTQQPSLDHFSFQVPVELNQIKTCIELDEVMVQLLEIMEDNHATPFYRAEIFKLVKYIVEEKSLQIELPYLRSIFLAVHHQVPEAKEYLSDLIQRYKQIEPPNALLETLVSVMSSPILPLRAVGEAHMQLLFVDYPHAFSSFRLLVYEFTTCCFREEWYHRSGGAFGVYTCVSLGVPIQWIIDHELDLIRALLYLLKSPEASQVAPLALKTLNQLLKMCNRPDNDNLQESRFQALISLLISELASSSEKVRDTVQSSLQLLADLTGNDVTELLIPSKDRLLTPIFAKPLRTLPSEIQIGHTDAITYCLSLRPPLLEFNDELFRFLAEALALADAEDQALGIKAPVPKQSGILVRLRIAWIRLLSAAIACSEFQIQKYAATRSRIVPVFFKALYNTSPEVVEASNKALQKILAHQNKLPRDLLQNGLKPILTNFADHSKLTVASVEGVARLLQLFKNYFKVEIGRKFLENLRAWAEPTLMEECAGLPLNDVPEIQVIVAILKVFPLLPPTANTFMEELVLEVTLLETRVRRNESSPFRHPLLKFLNRFPSDAVDVFCTHLHEPSYLQLFLGVIKLEEAHALRIEVIKNIDRVIGKDEHFSLAHCQILHALRIYHPEALDQSKFFRLPPLTTVRAHEFNSSDFQIVELYCFFLNVHACRTQTLLQLCGWISQFPECFLSRFVYQQLHEHYLHLDWDELLTLLEIIFNLMNKSCVHVFQHILLPGFLVHFIKFPEKSVLPEALIQRFLRLPLETYPEDLVIECFQLWTSFVKYIPQQIMPMKKQIIKRAWKFSRSYELNLKHTANAFMAEVVAAFNLSGCIGLHLFNSLIRAHQVEIRQLVKEAVDVLMPILKGLPLSKTNPWQLLPKKVLSSGENVIPQIIHVFQLLVTHSEVFYDYRHQFYPLVIASLPRFSLLPNSSLETRILTLDLVSLLISWEKQRLESLGVATKRTFDEMTSGSSSSAIIDRGPTTGLKDSFVGCLLRFSCMQEQTPPHKGISTRAVGLLKELLHLWPETVLKLSFLEKPLLHYPIQEDVSPLLSRAIDLCKVAIEFHKGDINLSHEIYRLINRILKSEHSVLFLNALQTLMNQLLRPGNVDIEIVEDLLAYLNEIFTVIPRIPVAVMLLDALSQYDPKYLEICLSSLLQCYQTIIQRYFSPPKEGNPPDPDFVPSIMKSILLINQKLDSLSEEDRQTYMSCLVLLIEKSTDLTLCEFLLDMAKEWVKTDSPTPTIKEKSLVLVKMMEFESKDHSSLMDEYLKLVSTVLVCKNEIATRLENAFLIGLKSENVEIRQIFMDILNQSLPNELMPRLEYIFSSQNWEPLAHTFYLHQILDVLFGAISFPAPVRKGLGNLHHYHSNVAHVLWLKLLPLIWSTLLPNQQTEVATFFTTMLTRDYHHRQMDMRPNVMYTILESLPRCTPLPKLAPHLIKYLGKTFNAWHSALEFLSVTHMNLGSKKEEDRLRDSTSDALSDLLLELEEKDTCIGLWRRRCQYPETNAALSYEQIGLWQHSQNLYEQAQSRGRTGILGFTESEYGLWEDQWVECSQKLQQWEVLEDVGREEGRHDMVLEALWRLGDWTGTSKEKVEVDQFMQHLPESPRKKVFQAFAFLNKLSESLELNDETKIQEFQAFCDEGVQMVLKKWHNLPEYVGISHVPLLAFFQQYVELGEALQIYISLSNISVATYDQRVPELHSVLQNWRDRLPNTWDDIDLWSNLVAWRQHVFGAINKAFFPILSANFNSHNSASAFRGFHETAWIINRLAHVARLHGLTSVCIQYLRKVYTLPNIEIQEAFLKLREQAKCYLFDSAEHKAGLDMINNTNLVFFNNQQKAEFYTLKGKFLAYLGQEEAANKAFAQAVTTDVHLAKTWAVWGEYQEGLYQTQKGSVDRQQHGQHAVNCFLHTIGLYKNGKARRYIARVLWLLSIQEKTEMLLTSTLEMHKSDLAIWYWLTFIPQLLTMLLDEKQAKHAKYILSKIAHSYPQALHYPLRALKEEMPNNSSVEEVMSILKKSAPLLVLTLETMIEELTLRLQPLPKEEMYHFLVTSINDLMDYFCTACGVMGGSQLLPSDSPIKPKKPFLSPASLTISSTPTNTSSSPSMFISAPSSMVTINRAHPLFARILQRFKETPAFQSFQERFRLLDVPENEGISVMQLIHQFISWRNELKIEMDAPYFPEHLSHYLMEFDHHRLDDVEVPGQYLALVDSNMGFIRIHRFLPDIVKFRRSGQTMRTFRITGHDGSVHPFLLEPSVPGCGRREERLSQLHSYLNAILDRSKESRQRQLQFYSPLVVSISPTICLVSHDPSTVTMEQIWKWHCHEKKITSDAPSLYYLKSLQEMFQKNDFVPLESHQLLTLFEKVTKKYVTHTLLEKFMLSKVHSYSSLWMLRKQFNMYMSTSAFISYVMACPSRSPSALHLTTNSGHFWSKDIFGQSHSFQFNHSEPVPFRLTPVLQHFLTPQGIEGPFSSNLMAISKALCMDGNNFNVVEHFLRIIVRDVLLDKMRENHDELDKQVVLDHCTHILMRMKGMLLTPGASEKVEPVNQPLLFLMNHATNPQHLVQMNVLWMPFF
ncbi:hypothetical protein HMI55_007110 [Coelomomyces lativittatus]|nr:hypothetical protein HMI55_007110 [Coelomomyces lativittatus]